MDIRTFNSNRVSPRRPEPFNFEDVAVGDLDAAYALDPDFDSTPTFQLLPGILCTTRPDGIDLIRMGSESA